MTADLPTVRAAIIEALPAFNKPGDYEGYIADAILAKFFDPAAQDELARWLVAQDDGPFLHAYPGNTATYTLRHRTRNEGKGS